MIKKQREVGTKLLDVLERALVTYLQGLMNQANKEITQQGAKNILAKIGLRIANGKELTDKILFKDD